MNRDEFNDEVRRAVRNGGSVEPKRIADELGVAKDDAKKWLDALYADGELELDLDDAEAFVYKRGKKLQAAKGAADKLAEALVPIGKQALASAAAEAAKDAVKEKAKEALLGDDDPNKKKLVWGLGLGFFFPGVGLFYAAPWVTAIVATLGVSAIASLLYLLSHIPILGGMLMYIVFGVLMLASGILGGVYTWQYNKHGKRMRLHQASGDRRALPF